jgi:hypothetical protein
METGNPHQEIIWVGKDQLTISGDHVIIDAAHEIPDWQVREFRRMPIFVGDFKFFLRHKTPAQPPFAMRYLLERWPENEHLDSAQISFTYDEQFVAERDAELSSKRRSDFLGVALICLYPVLGFLWSGMKRRLVPAGFIPRSITGVSIFTGFCLMLLQGTFMRMQLGLFTLLFGKIEKIEAGLLGFDYLLFAVMLVDLVLRFDQHMKDVEFPWGFGEWITWPFRSTSSKKE